MSAELPLHGGKVPQWMIRIMEGILEKVIELMVEEFGPDEVVRRLSDPFWFQALNNVIGMDWDSSGSTTVTLGLLKSITWRKDLGLLVLGGKGSKMLKVPEEAGEASERLNVDSEEIVKISKVSAKLDSALLQDGYELYIHHVILSKRTWTVVQQGMNEAIGFARRYHINKENAPWVKAHEAVSGKKHELVLDLSDRKSYGNVKVIVDLSRERPTKLMSLLRQAYMAAKGYRTLTGEVIKRPELRVYFPVKPSPQLLKAFERLHNFSPSSPEELLLSPAGPKVIRALALISHLIYGQEPSFKDPWTHPLDPFVYAYAIGGKDGVPYPFDRETGTKVIEVLREIIEEARLGKKEKMVALRGLRRLVEKLASSLPQDVR